jgi:quercetin dioxygenase-like cupin family protein
MSFRVLNSGEAFWRPSNQMKVENTDVGKQLETEKLAARFWRLKPGQASTKHRHMDGEEELYVVLEGTGRMRVGEELLTLEPLSAVVVSAEEVRQIYNDTDADALWFVAAAPPSAVASTLEMTEEQLAQMYPDGPQALPPELLDD